jgi:hypothetical protein
MRYFAAFFFIFVLILLSSLFAQDASTGAIRGAVTDLTGARIAGAAVGFVNTATGIRYGATTDSEGQFRFQLLPPAEYAGRASAGGMSAQTTPAVQVSVGAITEINFRLSVAGAKETVTVSGEPPLVDTQPSAISALIEEREIAGLPLNGRRFTDLSLLTPGVTQDPRGLTSGANGDLAFGGIRGYQSSYLVDGGDYNNGFFSQARGRYRAPYQFSNEVVKEFRVSSNTYGAELGRAGGAVVNVVTKSGSNHVHGSGFYFVRDSEFAATQAFLDFKPQDQQQQFGFTVGGPLRRNRAFFFAGFDQHIFHMPNIVRLVDGSSVITPQRSAGPETPGDYEDTDQALVFATAAQLSRQTGTFPASMIGNAGFAKLDLTLGQHNHLSARANTSRYYGTNNVFLDTASPLSNFGISDNGKEDVRTETGSLSLTTNLSYRFISHLRAQFSRDLQSSSANSADPLTRIPGIINGFGRSPILPRQTREHRMHLAETVSFEGRRHDWKFGGDALLTWIYNDFPSLFGGEYIFDPIKVDPFTFQPEQGALELTTLRAFAHQVPHYYLQRFGQAVTHPDTSEYAGFAQDNFRISNHLALTLGARYDVQTFTKRGLVTNPLWSDSGKVPNAMHNIAPRVGLAYSLGAEQPLVIRGGYGIFYTRIPQIYTSAIQNDNGLSGNFLFLNNNDAVAQQIFPQYPNPLVSCSSNATVCLPPAGLQPFLETDLSSFARSYRTPKVEQASLNVEREVMHRLAIGVSYMYVHGENLLRARDVNLPAPAQLSYPLYDSAGATFLNQFYQVESFSTQQFTPTLSCPFPPCINPLQRPISQLGSINVFETDASSIYQGATLSVRRRMSSGIYFRLSYTYARAMDDGQDALVAGRPALVQNSYAPNSERGPSVTDQRNRLAFSWITEPRPFHRGHEMLGALFNNWKFAGVTTYGSGRPINATVSGDPNQDDNSSNDRLPGARRNSFLGPDYATTDVRLTRKVFATDHCRFELGAEVFNAFNRDNQRVSITDDGFLSNSASFVQVSKTVGVRSFPGYYRSPTSFLRPTSAYAPRQMQMSLKMIF